jgi:hypothetical protein
VRALCARRDPIDRNETVERRRHGRHEQRRVEVFAPADLLPTGWRPHIACVGRITRLTWVRDAASGLWRARKDIAYYACQVRLDAAPTLGRLVRGHWGIENRAHHVRDRILREDDSRIRTKPGVFARLRSFALNLLRADGVRNVSEAVHANALCLDRLLAYAVT